MSKGRVQRTLPGYDDVELRPRCDRPGCAGEGRYRAPRSPAELRSYFWFCLDHVREYNHSWNYFAGMGYEEMEAQIRRDTVWDRPTWPLGSRVNGRRRYHDFADPFELFSEGGGRAGEDAESRESERRDWPHWRGDGPTERALRVLAVEPPVTAERIKRRYKELVKLHHPDANGGDRASEEKLKEINLAYSTLKNAIFH